MRPSSANSDEHAEQAEHAEHEQAEHAEHEQAEHAEHEQAESAEHEQAESAEHGENASKIDAGGGEAAPRDESVDDECYRLVSIDAVRAPQGCTGNDWYLYRITRGEDGITGYRRGDLGSVSAGVETIVAALNGRRQWTKSKASSKTQRRVAAAARRAAAK